MTMTKAEAEKAVVQAARTWYALRVDRSSSGMDYHRACRALAAAVAALNERTFRG